MALKPNDPDLDTIVAWMTTDHATKAELRLWLGERVGATTISRIAEAPNVHEDASRIVREIDRTNSDVLLAILKEGAQFNADLAVVAERYEATLAPRAVDPWQERFLWRRTVVLDRGPLRNALKTLVQTNQPKVLLVSGPRRSGKTKSADLIRHVADAHGHPCATVAKASEIDAADTVKEILVQLSDRSPVETQASPDTHWYRAQCARIIGAARDEASRVGASRCWLVIDDLGPPSGTVATLCEYLVRAVATSSSEIRLVLLGYPREALPDALDDLLIEWDRLTLGSVRDADVRDFLIWLYSEVVKKPLEATALASEVNALVGSTPPESEEFLGQLRKGLEERALAALKEVS